MGLNLRYPLSPMVGRPYFIPIIIELDDGKILTGKPIKFDGKKPMVSGSDFPLNQSSDIMFLTMAHVGTWVTSPESGPTENMVVFDHPHGRCLDHGVVLRLGKKQVGLVSSIQPLFRYIMI